MTVLEKPRLYVPVADEVWIATALLHKENPERDAFRVHEIIERVQQENLTGALRRGVEHHVSYHCVANKKPNPGRHRMLYATGPGTRRLFRDGDPYDPGRTGKTTPERGSMPVKYEPLLDWYHKVYSPPKEVHWSNRLRALAGSGREVWAGIDIDEYVRQLRED